MHHPKQSFYFSIILALIVVNYYVLIKSKLNNTFVDTTIGFQFKTFPNNHIEINQKMELPPQFYCSTLDLECEALEPVKIITTSDSNYVLIYNAIKENTNQSDWLIIKIDINGTVVNSVFIGTQFDDKLYDGVSFINGDIILVGSFDYQNVSTVCLDKNLKIKWSKRSSTSQYGSNDYWSILKISEEEILISGDEVSAPEQRIVGKIDVLDSKTGNVINSKIYFPRSTIRSDFGDFRVNFSNNNKLIVGGVYINGTSFYYPLIMKIDKISGNVIWNKLINNYSTSGTGSTEVYPIETKEGNVHVFLDNTDNRQVVYTKFDQNGNLLHNKIYKLGNSALRGVTLTANENFIFTFHASNKTILVSVDLTGKVLWSKETINSNELINFGSLHSHLAIEDNKILLIGTKKVSNKFQPYLYHFTTSESNCILRDIPISVKEETPTIFSVSPIVGISNLVNYIPNFMEIKSVSNSNCCCVSDTIMIDTMSCGKIKLEGVTYSKSQRVILNKPGPICDTTKMVNIRINDSLIRPSFLKDTAICWNQKIIIDIPEIEETWNNPEINKIGVQKGGKYWYTFKNNCYQFSDTINIQIDSIPQKQISNHITLCEGESYLFKSISPNTKWSTGEVGKQISVDKPGTYHYIMSNECGIFSDTLHISKISGQTFFVPNIFTPNNDGLNDDFPGESILPPFELKIFNRWGALLFQGSNIHWNGKFNNKTVPIGVYTYMIKKPFCMYKSKYGTVTVVY